jgi:hypothetical protein
MLGHRASHSDDVWVCWRIGEGSGEENSKEIFPQCGVFVRRAGYV